MSQLLIQELFKSIYSPWDLPLGGQKLLGG